MFTRTAQVLLRQKYEAETESIRSEYERVKNGIANILQETDSLKAENTHLIAENRKIKQNSIDLQKQIEKQLEEININKISLVNINNERNALLGDKDILKNDISNLDKKINDKSQQALLAQETLKSIQVKVSQAAAFLDKLNDKISNKKLELEVIKKEIAEESNKFDEKKKVLLLFENQVNEKALANEQENNRLEKYRERLNKRYEEFGLNIKL